MHNFDNLNSHRQLSDSEFLDSFSSCELPPQLFSHEAHLRLAFLCIQNHGMPQATKTVSSYIRNYVSKLGEEMKYHETLTIAAVHIVNHFKAPTDCSSFESMLTAHPVLLSDFKSLLSCHYSQEVLQSNEARTQYILPDKLAFDAAAKL